MQALRRPMWTLVNNTSWYEPSKLLTPIYIQIHMYLYKLNCALEMYLAGQTLQSLSRPQETSTRRLTSGHLPGAVLVVTAPVTNAAESTAAVSALAAVEAVGAVVAVARGKELGGRVNVRLAPGVAARVLAFVVPRRRCKSQRPSMQHRRQKERQHGGMRPTGHWCSSQRFLEQPEVVG